MSPGEIKVLIIGIYLGLLLCLGLFSSRLFRGTSQGLSAGQSFDRPVPAVDVAVRHDDDRVRTGRIDR